MKKYYAIFLIFTFVLASKAQYTITSADNPVVGDVEYYKLLDSTGIFHGNSGTGQLWNFSGINVSTVSIGSYTYSSLSSVPNNFMFPGATIASWCGSGNHMVYSNNSSKIELVGSANISPANCSVYSNPIKYFTLPFSYGSVNLDTFALSTIGYSFNGTLLTTGDGTGTLQLPTGVYLNVLKINLLTYQKTTSINSVSNYTIAESRYYSSFSKFPLLKIVTQTTTIVSGTTTTYYNKYGEINNSLTTNISERNNESVGFTIYPNPNSNGIVNMLFTNSDANVCDVSVFNALGQSVKTISFNGLSAGLTNKIIDLSELESGIYYIHLKAGKEEHTQRLTIMH